MQASILGQDKPHYPQQISHSDSVKLDIASIKKGKSASLLAAHQFMVEKEMKNLKFSKNEDLDKILVRFYNFRRFVKRRSSKSPGPKR